MATLERLSRADRIALYAPTDAPEARMTAEQFDRRFVDAPRPVPNVELVRGKLILRDMPYRLHSSTMMAVMQAFFGLDLGELEILPTVTSTFGEDRYEPDVALIRSSDDEMDRMVDQSEIQLAIEVSVSSLAYDRDEKTVYYAEGGVPEYWIVNPVARQIEVYRTPVDGRYAEAFLVLPGETLDALCLPGVEIAADNLLPNPEAA